MSESLSGSFVNGGTRFGLKARESIMSDVLVCLVIPYSLCLRTMAMKVSLFVCVSKQ
jgi:hypothetical protein